LILRSSVSCPNQNRGAIIAKPGQTFKKRQREHKLREKAQLKRDRRQQRAADKALGVTADNADQQPDLPEPEDDQLAAQIDVLP
jgi:hypothetical protein